LVGSYLLEYYGSFQPCSLCLLQRIALGCVFFTSSLGLYWRKHRVFAWLNTGFLVIGFLLVVRQIWLGIIPAEPLTSCVPSWLQVLGRQSLLATLHDMLQGSVECGGQAIVFGLRLPFWSALAFVMLLVINTWESFIKKGE
jgi:disulfide bond formation protein DsbB